MAVFRKNRIAMSMVCHTTPGESRLATIFQPTRTKAPRLSAVRRLCFGTASIVVPLAATTASVAMRPGRIMSTRLLSWTITCLSRLSSSRQQRYTYSWAAPSLVSTAAPARVHATSAFLTEPRLAQSRSSLCVKARPFLVEQERSSQLPRRAGSSTSTLGSVASRLRARATFPSAAAPGFLRLRRLPRAALQRLHPAV